MSPKNIGKFKAIIDASINYAREKYELGISVENSTNRFWNEAQFATEIQT